MGMVLGMCFGLSLGTALGSAFGNTATGTSLGLCIGMALGLLLGATKDKKVNKQIEDEGYTIKTIKEQEQTEEYTVTIVNKSGKETIVKVSKNQMDEEKFAVNDIVFLDDDGSIEQAYDKEDG